MNFLSFAILLVAMTGGTFPPTPPQPAPSSWAVSYPAWVERVEPYAIAGNLHYVGTEGIGAFLLVGDEGHMLIDGGLPDNAPQILQSVSDLGYDTKDIRILLNTHAHIDHSGGLAAIKKATGARLYASSADRVSLETGRAVGFEDKAHYLAPAVAVDHEIAHGETISLGNISVTAVLMPGHTPGCTSWQTEVLQGDEVYTALIFCSATVAGNRLVAPVQYPGVVEAYRSTFAAAKTMQPDIFLANHPGFANMKAKRLAQMAGDELAFVDRDSFPKMMDRLEVAFDKELQRQRDAGAAKQE